MIKVFVISVVMWWGNLSEMPRNDAVEIEMLHGKPLEFFTQAECLEHVDQNLEALKGFGSRTYPTADAVKAIYCIEKVREAT